ncbi:hypothetical protein VTN31DRAFT_1256 [Thermomyces dupontii]|uniref:uncharacterized protein n=1 Tax=Talaromyces thermophilus TaxID=28565 RepID=UPI003744AB61
MAMVNGVPVAVPPPEGYEVDFDNPRRRLNVAGYCVVSIGCFLAFTFLLQRLYVQWYVRRKLEWEDIGLIVAWLFSIAVQATITHGFAGKYLGVHAWEIPLQKFKLFVLLDLYVNPIIYAPPTALAKLVLLMFYLKLGNQSEIFRWSVFFVTFVNVGSNIGILFSAIFGCNPIRKGWDITVTDGTCINQPALYKATAALGFITDALIISLPVPMVLKLQMSRSRKFVVLFMFSIGSATVVTSIIRLVLLMQSLDLANDPTWGAGTVSLSICVEANLLIMCACLPTLRLFIRSVFPSLLSSDHRGSYSDGKRKSGSIHLRNNPRRRNYHGIDLDEDIKSTSTFHRFQTLVSNGSQRNDSPEETASSQGGCPKDAILQTKTMHITSDVV